jgi:uncharacterized protein YegL
MDGHDRNQGAPSLPSWLVSAAVHAVILVVFALVWQSPPRGAAEEPLRRGGIVLKQIHEDGEYYEDEDDQTASDAIARTMSADLQEAALAALPALDAAPDAAAALPTLPVLGAGPRPGGGVGDALAATGGVRQPRRASAGKARVRFYDLEGEGTRFVYVLDRSESMRGRPLESAKQQLIQSFEPLESTHQFQIIFFNHSMRIFDLTGGQRRIAFATEENKALAQRFVRATSADGGTDTASAMIHAVAMQADVIFLLTDAEDSLSVLQLETIRRKNGDRASINVVHFGYGADSAAGTYLKRLARQNGGRYVYVDTSRFGAAPKKPEEANP